MNSQHSGHSSKLLSDSVIFDSPAAQTQWFCSLDSISSLNELNLEAENERLHLVNTSCMPWKDPPLCWPNHPKGKEDYEQDITVLKKEQFVDPFDFDLLNPRFLETWKNSYTSTPKTNSPVSHMNPLHSHKCVDLNLHDDNGPRHWPKDVKEMFPTYKFTHDGYEEPFPFNDHYPLSDVSLMSSMIHHDVHSRDDYTPFSRNDSCVLNNEERFVLHLLILTFYKDQMRPYDYRIRKRLEEFHCSESLKENFLQHYSKLGHQYLVKYDDSSMTVYLKETPSWFKGWKDEEAELRPLTIDFWISFDTFLTRLVQQNRYTALNSIVEPWLSTRCGNHSLKNVSSEILNDDVIADENGDPKCVGSTKLEPYSLFKKCTVHDLIRIVEISVQLGLLVSEASGLVPVASSQDAVLKLMDFKNDVPVSGSKKTLQKKLSMEKNEKGVDMSSTFLEFEKAVQNLHDIVTAKNFKPLLLSKLKAKYNQRFKKDINPLTFGFTRLSDFLETCCSHFCSLHRECGRKIFVQKKKGSITQEVPPPLGSFNIFSGDQRLDGEEILGGNMIDQEGILCVPNALLNLMSKHRRFHRNLSFSFWQYCTVLNRSSDKDVSVVYGTAATFTDLLFASVLRPTSTESVLSQANTDELHPKHICSLRWFTREPLIRRGLRLSPHDKEECKGLEDFFFNVLPPRIPLHTTPLQVNGFKSQRPSRLRRQVTSQITKLNEEIFQGIPIVENI